MPNKVEDYRKPIKNACRKKQRLFKDMSDICAHLCTRFTCTLAQVIFKGYPQIVLITVGGCLVGQYWDILGQNGKCFFFFASIRSISCAFCIIFPIFGQFSLFISILRPFYIHFKLILCVFMSFFCWENHHYEFLAPWWLVLGFKLKNSFFLEVNSHLKIFHVFEK